MARGCDLPSPDRAPSRYPPLPQAHRFDRAPRSYGDYSRAIQDRAHGLDAVHDQVQQHLLQLNPVAEDLRLGAGQVGVKRDAVAMQLAANECKHLPDSVVDVDSCEWRSGFPGERAETADHVRRTCYIVRDA